MTVRLSGINFLTGSTITFGGVAATDVVFIDAQQFLATVPAFPSGAGPVAVVITEPSAVTVTLLAGFLYTAAIARYDIRRQPSINIRDVLNNAPNVATFSVDGKSSPPIAGTGVILTGRRHISSSPATSRPSRKPSRRANRCTGSGTSPRSIARRA